MDREPEDLQFVGIVGIVGEAFKLLRSFAKLLGAITLTLILPLCFAILGHQLVSKYLLNEIRWNEMAGQRTMRELTWEWTELFAFLAAYEVFVFAFSLLSTAAVVYTVASIYTGKEISYGRVMSIVPRVWKRLMVTFLWFFAIGFAYYAAVVLVLVLLIITMNLLGYLNTAVFIVCLVLIISVFCSGYVYITALVLDILYIIFAGIIGLFFDYAVLHGYSHGVRGARRGAYGTVLVGLLCFVHLMGLLIQSVFYFVCKSYHHESIDKSSLSDHLEVYLGDYEPLKSSNIQMDGLHASV